MSRLWSTVGLLFFVLAANACGDDGGKQDRGGSPPVAGGAGLTVGECQAGMTEYPSAACDCEMGRRVCDDDGAWGECICPEVDPCVDAVGWVCPNKCPGESPDEPRILQCVDGKPPTCECPEEG